MSGYDWQTIRDQYTLSEIVGRSVNLKKSGREHKGLCPFHNERTPSFFVNDDKQFYHCYGCQAHGDVIDFIANTRGISSKDAIAELTGGKLPEISSEDRKARQEWIERRRQEDVESSIIATAQAEEKWERAKPCHDHEYLDRKMIEAVGGIRQTRDGHIILPIHGLDGELQSIQTINGRGDKKYQAGAPVAYGSFSIGINMGERTIICEGYATGVSIYDAVGGNVCIAFDCGNMEKIARKYVEAGRRISLAADTGLSAEKMTALGDELGCPVFVPRDDIEMPPNDDGEIKQGTDFNDQAQVYGKEDVARLIRSALEAFENGQRSTAKPEKAKSEKPKSDKPTSQPRIVEDDGPLDISNVDLTSPPGFVGEIAEWIESRSMRSRKHLSVAAALTAIGNIAGLFYEDDLTGVTTNLFIFCVAGSGTGKDVPQKAVQEIMRAAGMAPAMHGNFKSEQEVYRNLIRHQAAFYIIDELGQILSKIKNAQKRGGAAYLEGVIAVAISAFTKADDWLLVTGDAKEEVRAALLKELAQLRKTEEQGEKDWITSKIASVERGLATIDNGLERPLLSVLGFSEPTSFNAIVDREWATNGLFRRVLIFNERETVPRRKPQISRQPLPEGYAMRIRGIVAMPEYDMAASVRIENYAERRQIPTTADAVRALEDIAIWFDDEASRQKETGLESLYLGGELMVSKVSLILAIEDGVRTLDHIRWAFALVRRDLSDKINMVIGNDSDREYRHDAAASRIVMLLDSKHSEMEGVILSRVSRVNKIGREDVLKALKEMTEDGRVICTEITHAVSGRAARKYCLPDR